MPKKYQYFVVLSEQNSGRHKRLTVFLDHPINTSDITDIEGGVFTVTNYKLLKVTGTFTYRFVFNHLRDGSETVLESKIEKFDHRITAATIEADYERFEDLCYDESDEESTDIIDILFHLEIPDD